MDDNLDSQVILQPNMRQTQSQKIHDIKLFSKEILNNFSIPESITSLKNSLSQISNIMPFQLQSSIAFELHTE